MRPAVAALAAIFLVACQSPSTPAPREVIATAVHSASDLHCSLPVVTATGVGFIDFPSGRFRTDPTAPTDYLFGLAYAFGAHKWVKTFYALGWQLISPDGTEFAHLLPATTGPVLTVDNLVTSKSRLLRDAPPGRVLGFLPDGLYIAGAFLYRVDVKTEKTTQIVPFPSGSSVHAISQGWWFWVTTAAAWYSLAAGPNQSDRNSVLSVSLADGKLHNWYTAPAGRSVSIIGFVTPDKPLVVEYNTEPPDPTTGISWMTLTAPGAQQPVSLDPSIVTWGVTDTPGVWLESPGHVWLYTQSGLIPMANVSSSLDTEIPGIAGPCR
jgi:hypothetical protein